MTGPDRNINAAITNTLARFAGTGLGAAVSGGGDSVALLLAVRDHCAAHSVTLRAATVNHGLRTEAAEEAGFVKRLCDDLGVGHRTLIWSDRSGCGNLQDRARQARYGLLANWAREHGLAAVLLGHTQDDQAETVLMRLARASGARGLRAMTDRMQTGNTLFLRPFLGVSRTELRAFLTRRQQTWCDDPDNTNDRFDRIKARRALTHLEPLGVGSQALAKVAAHMQTADTALRYYTGQAMQDLVDIRFGALRIDAKGFADLPMEIARRFTASAIQWCTNSTYPPRRAALARFITALGVGQTGTLGGCIGLVDRDAIWVGREPGAVQDVQCGADECWDGRWSVTGTAPAGSRLRAAGDRGLSAFPGWRNLGVPRRIMLATPAVWMGDAPIALPAAQEPDGWRAQLVRGRDDCAASLLSH